MVDRTLAEINAYAEDIVDVQIPALRADLEHEDSLIRNDLADQDTRIDAVNDIATLARTDAAAALSQIYQLLLELRTYTDGRFSELDGSVGTRIGTAVTDAQNGLSAYISERFEEKLLALGVTAQTYNAQAAGLVQAASDKHDAMIDAIESFTINEIPLITADVAGLLGQIGDVSLAVTNLKTGYGYASLMEGMTAIENSFTAQIDSYTVNLNASIDGVSSNLAQNYMTAVDTDLALAALSTTLTSKINTDVGAVQSALNTNYYTKTKVDEAVGGAHLAIGTSIDTYDDSLKSYLTDDFMSVTDTTTAAASRFSSLTSIVNGHTTSLQTQSNAITTIDGNMAASYSMRLKAGEATAKLEMVASDDAASGPSSSVKIAADDIILRGSVKADHIASGAIETDHLLVNRTLLLEANRAAFSAGKTSGFDLVNNGVYFGRTRDTSQPGNKGFGFVAGLRDSDGQLQYIQATASTGLKIVNAKIYRNMAQMTAQTTLTTSQTVNLSGLGGETIMITAIGGGAGGGNHDRGTISAGTAGGDTTIEILDGSTVVKTFTASGGSGYNPNSSKGEDGAYGTGGAAYPAGNKSANGYAASGNGAGGGAGGWTLDNNGIYQYDIPGGGGLAAEPEGFSYDISGLTTPKLRVTIGAGGAGRSDGDNDKTGGAGSKGLVIYGVATGSTVRADVIPLRVTYQGTMSLQGPFPDYGSGFWVLSNPTGVMGSVKLDGYGTPTYVGASGASFVSLKTPVILGSPPSGTIQYCFYDMGNLTDA